MTELFLKYYWDIAKYNLLFCILVNFLTQNSYAAVISFATIGMAVSLFLYSYFHNIEYYFYLNAGLSKKGIILKSFIINAIISLIILIILWSTH
jgi:hypothetical protein